MSLGKALFQEWLENLRRIEGRLRWFKALIQVAKCDLRLPREPYDDSGFLLTDEDRDLLMRVYELLEEVVESLEILEDRDLLRSIREAEEDVRAGRLRDYDDFIEELRESGEI